MSSISMPQFGVGGYRGQKFSIDFGLGLDVCSLSTPSLAAVHSQSGCTDTSRLSERH